MLHAVPDPALPLTEGLLEPQFHEVVSADGTRLRAWTNGASGPTVLLCNGLGTNPWAWPALLDPACGVRVVSWNHRGISGSERPADPDHVGQDAFVEDALAVMADAGVDACPVMGWSIGVNTMFELVRLHPSRVTGLFAVAGVPGDTFSSMLAPLRVPRVVRKPVTTTLARTMQAVGSPLSAVVHALPKGPLTALVSHSGFMLPTPDPANTRRALEDFLGNDLGWYMHLALASSLQGRISLRAVDVPTAFVAGRYDVLASSADMRTAAERIPGATYREVGGSHFVQMEHPEVVHEELLALLQDIGG